LPPCCPRGHHQFWKSQDGSSQLFPGEVAVLVDEAYTDRVGDYNWLSSLREEVHVSPPDRQMRERYDDVARDRLLITEPSLAIGLLGAPLIRRHAHRSAGFR